MKMALPTTISGWCMWLFFLYFGIGALWLGLPLYDEVTGTLAIAYAVFAFFGK